MLKLFNLPVVKDFEVSFYVYNERDKKDAKKFPPHSHDVIEFYFLFGGDASFVVNKQLYKLTAGDCIISRPGEVHNCVLNSTSPHEHACLWINSPSGFAISPFLTDNYEGKNLISPSEEDKKILFSLLQELDSTEDDFARYAITLNVLKILRSSSNTSEETLTIPETLKEILSYINENFTKMQDVGEILSKYFISKSTLLRLFKKHLNTTPKIYLETKKLSYSRILLKRGESVEDACFLSGFLDYSNYIRLFKKRFNVTPGKYKLKSVTIF